MRRMKNFFTVVLLLFVIAGCIFLPGSISAWKDERSFGIVTATGGEGLPQIKQNDLSVYEKLQLVSRFEMQDGSVTVSSQRNAENTALTHETLAETCKRELLKLYEMGILPDWNWAEEVHAYNGQVLTYIDSQNPENYVLLWNVILTGAAAHFELMLDDKTGKIYQMTYWHDDEAKLPPFYTIAECWGEYLGLRTEYPKAEYSEKYGVIVDSAVSDDGIVLYRGDRTDESADSLIYRFEHFENSYRISFLAKPIESVMHQSAF